MDPEKLELYVDELEGRIKELGDMIHKRGNDIADLRGQLRVARKAINDIAPWVDADPNKVEVLCTPAEQKEYEDARRAIKRLADD